MTSSPLSLLTVLKERDSVICRQRGKYSKSADCIKNQTDGWMDIQPSARWNKEFISFRIKMKILDLFNEYNLSPEMTWLEVEQPRTEKDRNTMSRMDKAYIVSKDFWWIKWLVDNDKIDLYKAKWNSDRIYYKEYWSWGFTCSNEEFVLMLLSISDEPIEFLCSILK